MDLLVHFHRYDFVYFDHHRVTKSGDSYLIWRKNGRFWEKIDSEKNKIRAWAWVCHRALVVESDMQAVTYGDPVLENVTRDTRNRELPELDKILLMGLQDDPMTLDLLKDVLEKGC